ncbi:VIT1/CCC1 transporter family protein [Candidatus Roizmanbacteria bacterium]|nr:VIT1/CCC1 transporter family protein [Candidatus Roizmanbacteria bacterium]
MAEQSLSSNVLTYILRAQKNEQTEYEIYTKLSALSKEESNKKLFARIAAEEKSHYKFWKTYTKQAIKPNGFIVILYLVIARIFGVTFATKLMEKGEQDAQELYKKIKTEVPEAKRIISDEEEHEEKLLKLINEERLSYVGSIVLGLNDALVELTGALAGLTLALQNARLVAVAGLITGIAASLSMAASEYLSVKSEQTQNHKKPLTSAIYTGITYLITVTILISPYFLLAHLYVALATSLVCALLIILFFTFYASIAQDVPFWKRFLEMAALSLGVATLTFIIGYVVRNILHIEI